MERGKIVLTPGSEGAPWDLELEAGDPKLAGAMLILLPAADGSYRVLVTRLQASASVDERLGWQVNRCVLDGLVSNHTQTVLS